MSLSGIARALQPTDAFDVDVSCWITGDWQGGFTQPLILHMSEGLAAVLGVLILTPGIAWNGVETQQTATAGYGVCIQVWMYLQQGGLQDAFTVHSCQLVLISISSIGPDGRKGHLGGHHLGALGSHYFCSKSLSQIIGISFSRGQN